MAKMTRLTPVLYFLFIGSVLANTGVLPADSGAFIRNFAELGIIIIMFALGFEESTDNFMASVKRSWGIALFGALAPFAVAYVIADYVWERSQHRTDVRSGDDGHGCFVNHGVAAKSRPAERLSLRRAL